MGFGMLIVRPGSEGLGRRMSIDDEGVPKILFCSFFADAMAMEEEDDGQRSDRRRVARAGTGRRMKKTYESVLRGGKSWLHVVAAVGGDDEDQGKGTGKLRSFMIASQTQRIFQEIIIFEQK